MKTDLRIPVLGLVDSDPYGLKVRPCVPVCDECIEPDTAGTQILSVYMSGSKNMSYDSSNLTTPDIKWLGVRPSDLDRCAAVTTVGSVTDPPSQQVQHSAAMSLANDRDGYSARQAAAARGLHQGQPGVRSLERSLRRSAPLPDIGLLTPPDG